MDIIHENGSFFRCCKYVIGLLWRSSIWNFLSGLATRGGKGRQSATPDSEKIAKNQEKEGKIRKKEGKSGRKGKIRESSFTLPLLTDRAGYATEFSTEK